MNSTEYTKMTHAEEIKYNAMLSMTKKMLQSKWVKVSNLNLEWGQSYTYKLLSGERRSLEGVEKLYTAVEKEWSKHRGNLSENQRWVLASMFAQSIDVETGRYFTNLLIDVIFRAGTHNDICFDPSSSIKWLFSPTPGDCGLSEPQFTLNRHLLASVVEASVFMPKTENVDEEYIKIFLSKVIISAMYRLFDFRDLIELSEIRDFVSKMTGGKDCKFLKENWAIKSPA